MPDAWENATFGNLAPSAAGDSDGDGRSNLSEWKARTNPLNSRDAFVITSATVNASRQTALTWPTVPGVSYRVQRSTVTSGGNIGTLLTGTGLPISYTDTAPPAGAPRLILPGRDPLKTSPRRTWLSVVAIRPRRVAVVGLHAGVACFSGAGMAPHLNGQRFESRAAPDCSPFVDRWDRPCQNSVGADR